MTREEFAKLTGTSCPAYLYYNEIEPMYYNSDEDKETWCRRVFGNVKSINGIIKKTAGEAIRINTDALKGCGVSDEEFDRMDRLIIEHIKTAASMPY